MTLDGTQSDFIRSKAREEFTQPKIGRVVRVYEHLSAEDDSNFECDIFVDGQLFEHRSIHYMGVHAGQVSPPKVGDNILLMFLESESDAPILFGSPYSKETRPPSGRAGMYRDVYESGESPVGDGNIKVTGYTEYTRNPAREGFDETNETTGERIADPTQAWYQISKEVPTPDPSQPSRAAMTMEMYDSPTDEEDAAHIKLKGTQVDGDDDDKELEVELDFKSGEVKVSATGANGDEFGIKMSAKDGTFKLVDESGYGIESDGSGNFTWHYESIDHSQGTTMDL